MKKLKGPLLLLITTMLWGLAFTAQSSAADKISSFTFNTARCLLAAVFMSVILIFRKTVRKLSKKETNPVSFKSLIPGGILCGVTLFFGMNLQQFGIAAYPEGAAASGRAGFLTATYVVMIPIVQRIMGKKLHPSVIAAVIGCIIGMYLLCMSGGFDSIYLGDVLELLCAVGFTSYILAVDRGADKDGVMISCIQFIVCGIMCGICMFIFEKPDMNVILEAWLPVVYAGIVSSGIGYTLQILGQKDTDPTVASIIMSLESVFAALCGWLVLGETLSPRELLGCALVFISVLAASLIPSKKAD